jgi:hypothetical protein
MSQATNDRRCVPRGALVAVLGVLAFVRLAPASTASERGFAPR